MEGIEIAPYVIPAVLSLIASFIIFFTQRKMAKIDKKEADHIEKIDEETRERAERRKRESMLSIEMMYANNQLSYATAIAQRDGKTNGELKAAIDSYEKAQAEYGKFLREIAVDELTD